MASLSGEKNTNVYSLDRCTKRACPRCDIGYILKEYVKPLMQLLTNDIREYNMQLLTTKCLNTAVMLMIFMLGTKKGIAKAERCDANFMMSEHMNGRMKNSDMLAFMQKKLLRRGTKYRELFYILMNDNKFPYPSSSEHAFFPGHVFILEKIPGSPEPFFYFYQSYINAYDFKGHVEHQGNTLKKSYSDVARMFSQIQYIINAGVWDDHCVEYWKEFTFVDTSGIKGSLTKDKLFICCSVSRVTSCIEHINSYVQRKMQTFKHMKAEKLGEVFGNEDYYDDRQKPLTNFEMKVSLEKISNDILRYKNNL
jgi:hypothetical protein